VIESPVFFPIQSLSLPLSLLLASLSFTCLTSALLKLGKFRSKELLKNRPASILRLFTRRLFPKQEWDTLYFSLSLCRQIYTLAFSAAAFFYLTLNFPSLQTLLFGEPRSIEWGPLFLIGWAIIGISLCADFVARLVTLAAPRRLLLISAPVATLFLLLVFPFVWLLAHGTRRFAATLGPEGLLLKDKARIREWIRESELEAHLDPSEQKLISSFIHFKERVAKEIMVPRIDMYSLPASTSLQEAGPLFAAEGYSRIPIYQDNLDHIQGVVLYKDLLNSYASLSPPLSAPLSALAKPVHYCPENKKISQLLQDLRSKHLHMAIVVDEYGGTEGIVTIEDILEELVGEIEDEYDIAPHQLFTPLPAGGWAVDAKMHIADIEEKLGVRIPEHTEYETIGGYVFHVAGSIPSKGWRLAHDDFELEILSSSERSIKKIKLLPRSKAV
jgi:CBS domain containing-hemolysin-like protein